MTPVGSSTVGILPAAHGYFFQIYNRPVNHLLIHVGNYDHLLIGLAFQSAWPLKKPVSLSYSEFAKQSPMNVPPADPCGAQCLFHLSRQHKTHPAFPEPAETFPYRYGRK